MVLHDVTVKPLVWVHVWHGLVIRALGPAFFASVSAIPIRIAMFVLCWQPVFLRAPMFADRTVHCPTASALQHLALRGSASGDERCFAIAYECLS